VDSFLHVPRALPCLRKRHHATRSHVYVIYRTTALFTFTHFYLPLVYCDDDTALMAFPYTLHKLGLRYPGQGRRGCAVCCHTRGHPPAHTSCRACRTLPLPCLFSPAHCGCLPLLPVLLPACHTLRLVPSPHYCLPHTALFLCCTSPLLLCPLPHLHLTFSHSSSLHPHHVATLPCILPGFATLTPPRTH